MNICIWYRTTASPWGGSNSFLKLLARTLQAAGHRVGERPQPGDQVVLANSWSLGQGRRLYPTQAAEVQRTGRATLLGRLLPLAWWLRQPRRGPPLVHRLDGIARQYGRSDYRRVDPAQFAIARLADVVVFQSRYAAGAFAAAGVRPASARVVHNGVDGALFYPAERPALPPRPLKLLAVSWSANLRKGHAWLPRLAALPGVEVRFIGNWPSGLAPGAVQCLGTRTQAEIAAALRQSHALVHTAQAEACSNAILEALACGLPVLYRASGANTELAKDFGQPLAGDFGQPLGDDEEIPSQEALAQALERFLDGYATFRERALAARPLFLIDTAAHHYLQAFQECLS